MAMVMNEILPGLFHWTTRHPPIGTEVSSYWIEPAAVVVDPKVPEEGLEAAWSGRPRPQQVVLTTGLHDRDVPAFVAAFDVPVRALGAAADRLGDALPITPYRDGEELAPGVTGIEIGVLAPDEGALHITCVPGGALALADAVHRYGEALAFFADDLLGDDPERVKDGVRRRLRAQLDREFDTLLFAHGDPLVGGGKAALRDFVTSPVGHGDAGPAR